MSLSSPDHLRYENGAKTKTSSETDLEKTLDRAREVYRLGQFELAKKICLECLEQNPSSEEALHFLGMIAFDENQFQKSIEYLEQAVQVNPESWKSRYALGTVLSNVNLLAESAFQLRKAIQLNQNEPSIHLELGLVLEKGEEYQAAYTCYEHCLQLNPTHQGALSQAGILLFKNGQLDEAEFFLESAINHSSEDPVLRFYYAELQKAKGNFQLSADWLVSILQTHPHSFEACFSLAEIFLAQHDFSEAINLYEKGLSLSPGNSTARVNCGCAWLALGEVDKAKTSFMKAIAVNPENAQAYFQLGTFYRNQENYPKARSCFEKVVELDPNHAEGFNSLGIVHHLQGNLDVSIQCYRESIRISPESSKAYANLELILAEKKKYDELIPVCEQAIEHQPDHAGHHYYMGKACFEKGEMDKAVLHLENAVRINPDHEESQFLLGNACKDQKLHERAIMAYRRTLKLNPSHLLAQYNLANTYKNAGELEAALDEFQLILKDHPDHLPSLLSMGNILRSVDRIEEAIETFESVQKQTGENPVLKLWTASLCPKVVHSSSELEAYHERTLESLENLISQGHQKKMSPDKLIASGTPPSYFLQFHGLDTLPVKQAYGRYYDQLVERTHRIQLPAQPTVGIFLTDGHEGVFIRYMGRMLEQLQTDDFKTVIICSKNCRKNIEERLSVNHIDFLEVTGSFSKIIDQIAHRGFDVLYHWEVGSDLINYALPFYQLAPVQVTSVGLPETTGIPGMNYFLSSSLFEDQSSSSHYSEELLKGNSLLTVQSRVEITQERSRSELGIPEGKNLYFCGLKLHKIHPDMDPIFGEILREDPNGILVIPSDKLVYYTEKLKKRFEASMKDVSDRIHFVPRLTHNDFCCLISHSDAILDTLYYGGGLSLFDFLSFNKPVVTLPGEFLRGKFTSGFFRHMEIEEFITNSNEEYIRQAVKLGTDKEYRMHWENEVREKTELVFDQQSAVSDYSNLFLRLIEINR